MYVAVGALYLEIEPLCIRPVYNSYLAIEAETKYPNCTVSIVIDASIMTSIVQSPEEWPWERGLTVVRTYITIINQLLIH